MSMRRQALAPRQRRSNAPERGSVSSSRSGTVIGNKNTRYRPQPVALMTVFAK